MDAARRCRLRLRTKNFFSPPVDHPKAQLPYVSLSTLSRYTRKTLVHHHHPRRFLRARRCTQQQSNNTNLARANSKSVSRGLLQIQTPFVPRARATESGSVSTDDDGKKLDARRQSRRPLSGAGCAQKREREKTSLLKSDVRARKKEMV